jgi:hypothetical protein
VPDHGRTADASTPPAYDDLTPVGGLPASWGLWGDGDRYGCLNLLTPDRTRAALADVRRGDVFPLNWRMNLPDPPLFDRPTMRHDIVPSTSSPSLNDVIGDWNTQQSTQWDGFRHVSRYGYRNYSGLPDHEHGIADWAERGIAGGAVLIDVERWRASVGRPLRHGTPDPITGRDLLDTLEAQGTEVRTGDVLLIRTGWIGWYQRLSPAERAEIAPVPALTNPGLVAEEETARVLWNLHPAAVAADNPGFELWPPGAHLDPDLLAEIAAAPERRHEMSLHVRLLPMLGLPIGELFLLDPLAEDCARTGDHRAFLTSAPLNLPGAAASPANALAVR